jgi:hypothetical protein
MSTARVDIIDRSFEKAHTWINDTADELGTGDSHEACLSAACSMRAGTPGVRWRPSAGTVAGPVAARSSSVVMARIYVPTSPLPSERPDTSAR